MKNEMNSAHDNVFFAAHDDIFAFPYQSKEKTQSILEQLKCETQLICTCNKIFIRDNNIS